MTNQLIMGDGEVGRALQELLGIPVWDPLDAIPPATTEVLHVAIPGDLPDFIPLVRNAQHATDADLVIVHSTVPVGTCDENNWVHSPVRGQHPHLVEGLRTFVKHFGGKGAGAEAAAALFTEVGVITWTHTRAATTEAGKLIELARLGVEVRVEKEIYAYCVEHDLDFSQVYTDFTRTYNSGYLQLHQTQFVKPTLYHMPGPLGGHCVGENLPLLDSDFFYELVWPVTKDGWEGELD